MFLRRGNFSNDDDDAKGAHSYVVIYQLKRRGLNSTQIFRKLRRGKRKSCEKWWVKIPNIFQVYVQKILCPTHKKPETE
jgi:hypothetical protein